MIVGLAGLAFMLTQIRLTWLWQHPGRAAAAVVYSALVHLAVIICDAAVLVLCTARPLTPRTLASFTRAFLAGHGINLATPSGSLGEITKFTLLRERVAADEAAAGLLLHNLIAFEVNAAYVAIVAGLGTALLHAAPTLRASLVIAAVVFLGVGVAFPLLLRRGLAELFLRLLARVGFSAKRVARARTFVTSVADDMGRFLAARRRALAALALAVVSRLLGAVEVWLLLSVVGGLTSLYVALLMLGTLQVVSFVVPFVPLNAGTGEGSLYLLFLGLGRDPAVAITAELLRKAQRLLFVVTGVAILGVRALSRRSSETKPPLSQAGHAPGPAGPPKSE